MAEQGNRPACNTPAYAWHSCTLSSHKLHHDCILLHEADEHYQCTDCSAAGLNNASFYGTNGGRPMLLDGSIVLCGRSDAGVNGSYDGALSSLSLYDNALNSSEIQQLYNKVM